MITKKIKHLTRSTPKHQKVKGFATGPTMESSDVVKEGVVKK